ncbi:MAG: VCBS repeat-containing protein [Candidatus Handelsmanbacteria bacterium]|nr:VCBS repeat-containing protein [Candidatus Handelsmanbacteria bacterium]
MPAQGYSAVAGDVNLDGRPDIYVASYNHYGLVMPNSWHQATNGTPNLLFINQGGNRFAEQAAQWGVADNRWSYAAQIADLNEDGRPDLYLANDFGEKAFYLNDGTRFRDVAAERGMLDPGNGMGLLLGDFDNDGDLDLHITNMSSTAGNRIIKRLFPEATTQREDTRVLHKLAAGNTLFRNLGGGNYEDVSAAMGPFPANWAWGGGGVHRHRQRRLGGSPHPQRLHHRQVAERHLKPVLAPRAGVYRGNGAGHYHLGKIFSEGFSFSGFERDKLFLNNQGQKYIEVSGLSGLDSVSDGRGAAYGDFDNDGDLDVFLTTLQGQIHYLFRNNVGQENHFVRVSLEGRASGQDA